MDKQSQNIASNQHQEHIEAGRRREKFEARLRDLGLAELSVDERQARVAELQAQEKLKIQQEKVERGVFE